MSRVQTESILGRKEILRHSDNYAAIPVTIDSTLEVDGKSVVLEHGRKIVKAGAILGGKEGAILTEDGVVVIKADETAEGILLNDTDITDGDIQAAMVIRGDIYLNKLPVKPEEAVIKALATRLLLLK